MKYWRQVNKNSILFKLAIELYRKIAIDIYNITNNININKLTKR